jgi:indolepyruvate ferredoxin oxidoreductase beta subunit
MPIGVINIRIAGLGGQGVIKASDLLAEVAFQSEFDVKKSELHGMSQRGGTVYSDVRFGPRVFSPMVPTGEVDFLVVVELDQKDNFIMDLKSQGCLITSGLFTGADQPGKRFINIALLGALSVHLPFEESVWLDTLQRMLPSRFTVENQHAFSLGKQMSLAAAR